ncbi:flagellar assembly protein FlaA [Leptospira gomenensis]|uniref:Flagellar assembly protein FlaA n=1 Tax=Leptospira gomenensis TaxID=2484974 RepID=A0A5F1YGK1_9LEPT|nr:flagellar filament outer layer protein FlaA [Leptospira gomenensis]TGK39244.1 flagellar assembly protein FlaA [Leptospira gomenensis]TGK42542.1 flagellar assembly protein FlaA [Leptospira gomenensis]TGK48914.1 flagellar assembly protein FlaA [Leptospira gomenensis]TGK54624.1 flagellar assembly protein FlaA [Leptospira gomenensis]
MKKKRFLLVVSSMRRFRIRWTLIFFFVFLHPLYDQEKTSAEIWKEVVVENFETKEWSAQNLKTRLGKEYLPDIRTSKLLLSPEIDSSRSLLLEVPAEKNQSFEILWEQPWKTKGFVRELKFQIYSSGSGASLYVLLRDSSLEVKKILITHLNYEGWKNVRINLVRKIRQDDVVFTKQASVEFLGLLYEAPFEMKRGTRDLFAIDDILAVIRDKKRMFSDEKSLIR